MNRMFQGMVLLLVLLLPSLALAQTETGQITGTVVDPTGAAVPSAKVTITSTGTNAVRITQTNNSGLYIMPNLLPGDYQVKVEATGFSSAMGSVTLSVGARVARDFKLEIGNTSTVVEVSDSGATVNTESQTLSTVVNTRQVLELPTLTRNPYDLVAISGNVANTDPSGRGVGYAVSGLRSESTNILLDGAANNDEFTASTGQRVPLDSVQEFSLLTSNFSAEFGRAGGGIVNVATKSGTNEFHGSAYEFNRVAALASNDFDSNANGLNKANYTRNQFGYSVGGPAIKDKLFFFNSTEWTRVRSAANAVNYVPNAALLSRAAPNTQSFFSTYGTLRNGVQTLQTLTKDQLINDVGVNPCAGGAASGPCASLPGSTPMFDRVAYTVPNDSGAGVPQNTYFGTARVDYNLSEKTQIYARYAYESEFDFDGTNSSSPYQNFDTGTKVFNNNILVSATHTFSPALVSQSKIVFNRLNNTQPLSSIGAVPTLYLASQNVATSLAGTDVALPGYLPFNPGSAIPFGGPQNFVQAYQDFSYLHGKHQLRFGGSYEYIRDNRTFGAFQNPVEQIGRNLGNGIDNLLSGMALSFRGAIDPQGKFPCGADVTATCTVNLPITQPSFSRSNRYHEWAAYFNDSWKVARTLTVNLGVRYEYYGVQHNKNPYLDANYYPADGGSIFQQLANGAVAVAPQSSVGALWKPDRNNFAPRLGFAWDVFGDGKTSVRGGYGMSYIRNFGNVTFNLIQNPPNYQVISVSNTPITTSLVGPLAGSAGQIALPQATLRMVDPNIRNSYVHFWNFSVEREIIKDLTLAVDYSGNKGQKLYSLASPNYPGTGNVYLGIPCTKGDGPGDPGDCVSGILPTNYGYTSYMRRNDGFSNYNALNVRVQYNNVGTTGLTLTGNYTYSHAIDNLSDTFSSSGNNYNVGFTDFFYPGLDRGNAAFDLRHRVSISAIYAPPFAKNLKGAAKLLLDGWSVAPIITAQTGAPYTLFDCTYCYYSAPRAMFDGPVPTTNNAPNTPTATPNQNVWLDLAQLPVNHGYVNAVTNLSDFGPYPSSMSGRNVFRGPGSWNLNASIAKSTKFNERFTGQLRLELYNAFNHANLYVNSSGSAVDVSAVDRITSYRSGNRNVQLGFKLLF